MDLRNIPEEVVKETSEYKCLQSQFSLLYNESLGVKTQLDEARALLLTAKNAHLRQIEHMEVGLTGFVCTAEITQTLLVEMNLFQRSVDGRSTFIFFLSSYISWFVFVCCFITIATQSAVFCCFLQFRAMSCPFRRSWELRSSSWKILWLRCAKSMRCCALSLSRTWQPMSKQVLELNTPSHQSERKLVLQLNCKHAGNSINPLSDKLYLPDWYISALKVQYVISQVF